MRSRSSLLLDTHIVLWWRSNDPRLTEELRRIIANAGSVLVSAAAACEVAIKLSVGRLRLPEPFADGVAASGFGTLDITFAHAAQLASLPLIHRDPFDRIMIAQAKTEGLTLVTKDPLLARYEVDVLGA